MLKFFTKIWLRFFDPIWNLIPAWIESRFYDKRLGRDKLALLRSFAPDVRKIEDHMRSCGFQWTSDPLGGSLDFHSLAWVTCARKKGDCDDWAHLWVRVLKAHGKVEKVYTRKKGGGAHAMAIFTRNGVCYLLSNLGLLMKVPEYEKEHLLTRFYGDETDFSIIV